MSDRDPSVVGSKLDATGIQVDLIDTDRRDRFGHPSWTLPLGGGTVRKGGVVVEVRPLVEMATDRWRDHDDIQRLADRVEQDHGFMWHGDEIHVGDEIVVGRDALQLLTELRRRSGEREGDEGIRDAAYRQGFEAAKRQCIDAATAISPNGGPS